MPALGAAARGEARRQEAQVGRRDVDAPAPAVQPVRDIVAGGGDLAVGHDRDRPAMSESRRVGDAGGGLHDAAGAIGDLAARAARADSLDLFGERQQPLRVNGDGAAGPARGADPPAEICGVRPYVDGAAVALGPGTFGEDEAVRRKRPRIDLDAPAAGRAGRRHERAGLHRHPSRTGQRDDAVRLADRGGADHAADIDRLVDDLARRRRAQHDAPARGADLAVIFDQRAQRPAVAVAQRLDDLVARRELDQPVAIQIEREPGPRSERHAAEIGLDDAGIPHMRRDESRDAGLADGDGSLIDDGRAPDPAVFETDVPARHEGGVVDVMTRHHEPADIDCRASAEENAVAVDENDLSVGGQ